MLIEQQKVDNHRRSIRNRIQTYHGVKHHGTRSIDNCNELDMSSVESVMALSAYMLATAFGPLVKGPLSEIYGRKPILHASNISFLVWNIVYGFASSKGLLIAARLLAGFGASAIYALAGMSGRMGLTVNQNRLALRGNEMNTNLSIRQYRWRTWRCLETRATRTFSWCLPVDSTTRC